MDQTTPTKFLTDGDYYENFPSSDEKTPEHYTLISSPVANGFMDPNADASVGTPGFKIPSQLIEYFEVLQQEVHSLEQQSRCQQLELEEYRVEVRNLELELEIGREERDRERGERRKEELIAADVRMEVEEKLAASQGDLVALEKKLEHSMKRDQKYKERIHMLQNTLIEFQEQSKEVEHKLSESGTTVQRLTSDRNKLREEICEVRNDAEILTAQNQELLQEVTWHRDELDDTKESLHHLQKEFEFQSLRQTVQTCGDEVSLLEEMGREGIFGSPIHLQEPDSADEQTDIPEYLDPQSQTKADSASNQRHEGKFVEKEVDRVNRLEQTISSLMEQLESANDECSELHSELFTTRAQVKLQERDTGALKDKLTASEMDRERMRNKINKARAKIAKSADENKMLHNRCLDLEGSLEKREEENISMERQLIQLIEQKIMLAEEIAAYEIDVGDLLKANMNRKLEKTVEDKPKKTRWFF